MTTTDTTPLTPSTAHELLSSERRARVIEFLAITEERSEVPIEAIVEYLAEEEDVGQAVRVTLRHQHIPLLADVGVVEFDIDSGVVRPRERCKRVYRAQKAVEEIVGG